MMQFSCLEAEAPLLALVPQIPRNLFMMKKYTKTCFYPKLASSPEKRGNGTGNQFQMLLQVVHHETDQKRRRCISYRPYKIQFPFLTQLAVLIGPC